MRVQKAVSFGYDSTSETTELLETFRAMVNDAIRISLDEQVRGRLNLRNRIYKEFQNRYGVTSRFPYSVAEVAWSIVKKHLRWQRRPVAKRLMMKMDSENYTLNHGLLSIPNRLGRRILIPLAYGDHQRSFLTDTTLRRGSMTLTERTVLICFSKDIEPARPAKMLGIDLNERSAVLSDGSKYDLSEVSRIHTEYGIRRKKFHSQHQRDRRLLKKFSAKSREKNRVKQSLNRVSKAIVEKARMAGQGIVLEKLKGIRFASSPGEIRAKSARRRLASWPFHRLQQQIVYKARWAGIPVEYVSSAWTTKTCHHCSSVNRNLRVTDREWRCPSCGAIHDRDVNAAINIERRGKTVCLAEVRPGARGE